mgnify:CR=1 FL=1
MTNILETIAEYTRKRIEEALVGNFGFLQIGKRSPRLVRKKALDQVISFNGTKQYSPYSNEPKREIQIYEIGHIRII